MTSNKIQNQPKQWDSHAQTYDLIYSASERRRVDEEIPFFQFVFSSHAKCEVQNVLDITAGTGLQAVDLAKLGLNVTAADLSAAMLERCRRRAAEAGVELARIVCRPAERTDEYDSFDACISCFGSLNHILEADRLQETFVRVHHALRSGGVFVFDLLNFVEDAMSCPPEDVREGKSGGIAYRSVLTSRVDTWNSLLHYNETTTINVPGQTERQVSTNLVYRGYSRSEVVALLAAQPWSDVATYRGYLDRGESNDERVFRMVFVCVK
ncbi:MAG: class I SAM-dependent methyltransferase [Deltaproteobacteria bacterium]|nr:class I SAM-dependent methyltransferase [Deltaproteobacteria bacterium]